MDLIAADTDAAKSVHQDFICGYYTLPAIHTFAYPSCGELLRKIAADIQSGVRCREEITEEISKLIEDPYPKYLSGFRGKTLLETNHGKHLRRGGTLDG